MSAESSEREFAAWAESLHAEYDAFLRQSLAAMQAARKGHWIADTAEHVRAAGEAFRRQALEKLLPAQVAAGQDSFSPSGGGWTCRRMTGSTGRRPASASGRGSVVAGWAVIRWGFAGRRMICAGWRHKVVHLALEQDVDAVLDEVTQQRTAVRSPAKRAALSRPRNYVGQWTSMIR